MAEVWTSGTVSDDGPPSEGSSSSLSPRQDDSSVSCTNRHLRNIAEKMRRDKLNKHISELASIVPIVQSASKKIDKTSVLRLSAAYLRMYQNLLNSTQDRKDWTPLFPRTDDLGGLLLEAINGFLLIVNSSGKVVYVSNEIEKILGHSPIDVLGHSIYNILHDDDHDLMHQRLQCSEDEENRRRSFYCRLAERCLSRSDCSRYDLVHVLGHIRTVEHMTTQFDGDKTIIQENLLVSIVRLLRNQPIREISWMAGQCDEYITHHMLDGRILCADHRIALITGHLPQEVSGKSAYDYIYQKDIPVAQVSHREIFRSNNGTIRTVYRLRARTNKLVFLRTQGILQYHSMTHKVDSFICINKLLSEEEGKLELHRHMIRFKPSVNHQSDCTGDCSFLDYGDESSSEKTFKEESASSSAEEETDNDRSKIPDMLLREIRSFQSKTLHRSLMANLQASQIPGMRLPLTCMSHCASTVTSESSDDLCEPAADAENDNAMSGELHVNTVNENDDVAKTNGKQGSLLTKFSSVGRGRGRRMGQKRTYNTKLLTTSDSAKNSINDFASVPTKKSFFQGKQVITDSKVTPKRKRGRPRKRPLTPVEVMS